MKETYLGEEGPQFAPHLTAWFDQRGAELRDKGYIVDWEVVAKVQSQIDFDLSPIQQEQVGKLCYQMRGKDSPLYQPTEQGMLEACAAWAKEQGESKALVSLPFPRTLTALFRK